MAHARAHDVAVMTTQPGDGMPTPADPDPQAEPETEEPEGDVDDLPRPAHLPRPSEADGGRTL
jgi:hypothetical protein